MADWPSTIDKPRKITEKFLRPANRSNPEAGYVSTRPMWADGVFAFTLEWPEMLTPDKETLITFFNANQGGLFNWTHPETDVVYACLFMDDELSFESAAFGFDTDGSPLGIWQTTVNIREQ